MKDLSGEEVSASWGSVLVSRWVFWAQCPLNDLGKGSRPSFFLSFYRSLGKLVGHGGV